MIRDRMRKITTEKWIAAVLILLFFIILGATSGIGIYDDTNSYVVMSTDRDPLYAVFLWLLRLMFRDMSFTVAVVLQNILMAGVGIYLMFYLIEQFRLKLGMTLLCVACLLVPHALIPLATTSGMVLSSSILSEGISFPLYLLFFTLLIQYAFAASLKKRRWYAAWSLVTAVLASLARGQLMVLMIAWGVVVIFRLLREKRACKQKILYVLLVVCLTLASFGVKSVAVNTYNKVANGVYTGNTADSFTMLTNFLFSTDLDKSVKYEDSEIQYVYDQIRDLLQAEQLNMAYAPDSLNEYIEFYEHCHDEIKFNQIVLPIHMYVRLNGHGPGVDTTVHCNETAGILLKPLMFANLPAYVQNYCLLAIAGFIRTVAFLNPLFNWYALLVYVAAVGIMLYLLLRSRKEGKVSQSAVVMAITLLLIVGLVCAISLVTACISRYVIYNMSIFYIALLLMLRDIKE